MSDTILLNNPNTMRKYRIHESLAVYSAAQRARLRSAICDKCGIVPQTLSMWENITRNEARMIPADHLAVIAELLATTVENLLPAKQKP